MSPEDKALDDFMEECKNPRKIVQGDFQPRKIPVSSETELIKLAPYAERKKEFER